MGRTGGGRGRWLGFSLPELLTVVALLGLAIAVTLPAAARLRRGARLQAGVRELALEFQSMRWKSVALQRSHGLWFQEDDHGWYWYSVQDGNGNGMRAAELREGIDRVVSGPHRIEDRVAGIGPGIPQDQEYPAIPPGEGNIQGHDPIRFGSSDLVAFGPLGTSSSGTLYLTDGDGSLAALRLYGASGRVRRWLFRPQRAPGSHGPGDPQRGWRR